PRASSFLSHLLNAPAPTEIYSLSLHDALPIYFYLPHMLTISREKAAHQAAGLIHRTSTRDARLSPSRFSLAYATAPNSTRFHPRSEEHTSELQSRENLVCRLLLEKKKQQKTSR